MNLQSERFYELLDTMKKTHDAKRHDYANEEDVFANFRTCETAGIPAGKGCCVRLGDKFSRIMGFAKKEKLKVKDESIKDTLIDMANYALIALILYEEEQQETGIPNSSKGEAPKTVAQSRYGRDDFKTQLTWHPDTTWQEEH